MRFQYLEDNDVSLAIDKQIRNLLSLCFIKDREVFGRQRFFNEMPGHRYLLWEDETLIAHIAVHDKQVLINDIEVSICGIAEVCVSPKYRGKALVKQMLNKIHIARIDYGDAYSLLFGEKSVYTSSGYLTVNNLKALNNQGAWNVTGHTMVHALNKNWPNCEVKLLGIPF